jgi:hypothetical protein
MELRHGREKQYLTIYISGNYLENNAWKIDKEVE